MHEGQVPEEILKFFDKNYGGLEGFVVSGRRRGLDPESIRKAAVVVYHNHHNGKPYLNYRVMGQHLLLQAHKLQKKGVRRESKRLDDLERRITALENIGIKRPRSWFSRLFDDFIPEGATWL